MKLFGMFALLLVIMLDGCETKSLEDFSLQDNKLATVSAAGIAGEVQKTNESIIVPVSVKLNGNASKAFDVGLSVNQDTVQTLIQSGELTAVVAVAPAAITVPNVVKVSYGADSASFEITISRTEVEKYFGKQLALAYSLNDPTKGNIINSSNRTGIIILDTKELLTTADIHYLSIRTGGGEVLQVKNRQNYESTSGGMAIPIIVNLASFPSQAFSANIVSNVDTIAQMVTGGLLPPNTIALNAPSVTIPSRVQFPSNTSEAKFEIAVPWSVISANVDKQLAVLVRLSNPTLHVLDETKSDVVVLIDCENVIEIDVTNLGVFSVNRDNNSGADAGEGSKKMVDNNFTNKFLQQNFTGDLVCKLVFEEAQKIGAYTLTSGNDAQTRDPNAWNLQGSDDGENWTTIDSRVNEVFETRLLTRRFDVLYPIAFKQYRLNITSNVGSSNFQITEWRMIRTP